MTNWRYIQEDQVSADYGLATDEFLMNEYHTSTPKPGSTLRLYTYQTNCALVGRFQNIEAELHLANCAKENIQIGRRLTGGGAIIMGKNQLGVCLTTSDDFAHLNSRQLYEHFAFPVIKALHSIGINATFRSKNDLEVNNKKIAGLGVYSDGKGALLFHASILVDLDISLMLRVLKIPMQKISDKSQVNSISQRITTVSNELGNKIEVDKVRSLAKKSYEENLGIYFENNPITKTEKYQIQKLAEKKYSTEDWIFQRMPQLDMNGMSLVKTPDGLLRTYISLKGDNIKSVIITGDFMQGIDFFNKVESQLKWQPFDKEKIQGVVQLVASRSSLEVNHLVDSVSKSIFRAGQRALLANRQNYEGSCYYPEKENAKIAIY